MYERTYKVKIYDSNRIIIVKGKQVRTPTEAIVSSSDLNVIRTCLLSSGCKNFVVEDINEPSLSNFQEVYNKEVIIPLEKKVVPTYAEVKAKLSSKIKVQPKISRTRQKGSVNSPIEGKFRNETPKTSFYIPLELQANRETFFTQIPIKEEDFEIRIDNLKVESSNILKKILKESER